MKKLIMFNMISLDGFFEGPNKDITWHVVDEEFNQFSIEQIKSVETILFGRLTYELMAGFWPSPTALAEDPIVANLMNSHPKIVFSNTLHKAEWNNTRLVSGDSSQEVKRLKMLPGKDLMIFGSGELVSSLTRDRLIDEYRLMVNPVVLGNGRLMFSGLEEKLPLRLLSSRIFKSGNVLLSYQLVKGL